MSRCLVLECTMGQGQLVRAFAEASAAANAYCGELLGLIDGSPSAPVGGRNGVTRPEQMCNNILRLPRRFGPSVQTPSLSHSVPMLALRHPKDYYYGQLHQPLVPTGV